MPSLALECTLPSGVYLLPGEYPQPGHPALIGNAVNAGDEEPRMRASVMIAAPDALNDEQKDRLLALEAQKLLRRLNLLLRWHRTVNQRTNVRELTLAQASPFRFLLATDRGLWGEFSASTSPVSYFSTGSPAERWRKIRDGFAANAEPPVEDLLLLDARQSLHEGRFRETVLISWSVIDSNFNRNFDRLAQATLGGEWPDALRFVTGNDFGLRNKMTIGLRLVAGRSLHRETNDFWTRLSESYKARNKIIHEGSLATEDQAKAAIAVAEHIISVMSSL
jgi:hypothetical protein